MDLEHRTERTRLEAKSTREVMMLEKYKVIQIGVGCESSLLCESGISRRHNSGCAPMSCSTVVFVSYCLLR